MQLNEILSEDRIACDVEAPSKKRALEHLSQLLSIDQQYLSPADIFESLISRERLGSTGIGYGVAIPHGRIKNSDHISAAFIQLKTGIDFDAIDEKPVDLLFALVVPEDSTENHLQTLAALANMFSDTQLREQLRTAGTPAALLKLIQERQELH
ncbi:MAG: PTS IIA-like nitrogen regulatory protein PtsN [Gammaproteobacteria bacterium]|nr:PTS IIA-like nitrogen regulatory protein PtsN [Gammaproteobacteria bacterium]